MHTPRSGLMSEMAYLFIIHGIAVLVVNVDSDSEIIVIATFLEVAEGIIKKFRYPFWQGVATEVNFVTNSKRVSAVTLGMSTYAYGDHSMPKFICHYRSSADSRPGMADYVLQRVYAWRNGPGLFHVNFLVVLHSFRDVGQLAESSTESTLCTSHIELVPYLEARLYLEK